MARTPPTLHGVLVVDKPAGISSHDVVARVRRAAGQREVGHAGTLDPMATGVLVVLLGEATKLTPWLTADDKRYACTLALGRATDSGDADGVPAEERPLDAALLDELQRGAGPRLTRATTLERARGLQVPPAVSAIHVNGERAYDRARRGEEVVLDARPVRVRSLEIEAIDAEARTIACTLHVSKGYYVRAFARDFAETLGTVAHLTRLRRLASGAFTLAESAPLDGLEHGAVVRALIPCAAAAARALPTLTLDADQTRCARQGKRFPWPEGAGEGPHAWLDARGDLVAVGESREGLACVTRGFFAAPAQSD